MLAFPSAHTIQFSQNVLKMKCATFDIFVKMMPQPPYSSNAIIDEIKSESMNELMALPKSTLAIIGTSAGIRA